MDSFFIPVFFFDINDFLRKMKMISQYLPREMPNPVDVNQ